jgi:hypothetical protein
MMFVGAVILVPKQYLDPRLAWDAARITLAGILTVVVGSALLPVSLILAVGGGAITYVAAALILRCLSREELRPVIERVVAKLPRRSAA